MNNPKIDILGLKQIAFSILGWSPEQFWCFASIQDISDGFKLYKTQGKNVDYPDVNSINNMFDKFPD